jgi:hypothetical protein
MNINLLVVDHVWDGFREENGIKFTAFALRDKYLMRELYEKFEPKIWACQYDFQQI